MGLMDQLMANLYKPPKQEKTNTILPKHLTPAKTAALLQQTMVSQGQYLKGEVLDLRANQIMVLLENGATVSARTEGTLPLSIGQSARFLVAQTTDEQILLKLAKEDTPKENPMIDKALAAAHINKTERSVSLVTELLAHQQPVNEATLRHYLSLSAKHPELHIKNLVLMELHHIPVTKENVEQFAAYQTKSAKLPVQLQQLVQELSAAILKLPEGNFRQTMLQEFATLLHEPENRTNSAPAPTSLTSQTLSVMQPPAEAAPRIEEHLPPEPKHHSPEANDSTPATAVTDRPLSSDSTSVPKDFFTHTDRPEQEFPLTKLPDSFLLKPADVADPEKVQDYYKKLNETLVRLEQLSQKLSESTATQNTGNTAKQPRQNLSFMETVNNIFPYIQLPLKFRETPAHGELYVYEKKKALSSSDTLRALLHLELDALGTMDIYVTLSGTRVTTRFSVTDKESGDFLLSELPTLTKALADKGYLLQAEVSVQEATEKEESSLLEQFLSEQAPGGLHRYTFDIRA